MTAHQSDLPALLVVNTHTLEEEKKQRNKKDKISEVVQWWVIRHSTAAAKSDPWQGGEAGEVCRGRALPVRCDRQVRVAPVVRMKVSRDLAGEVGNRRSAGGRCRRRDPSGPGVSYTAMGREGHPAFCDWM